MAYHLHRQIREAAVTALTGLATTGSRVYANRLYPMDSANFPGLRVSTDDEAVEPINVLDPVALRRELTLAVECCAQAASGLDNTCDQMQKEVEVALSAGLTIGGRKLQALLTSSRYDDEPAATPAAVKRLEFLITFHTLSSTPDVLL